MATAIAIKTAPSSHHGQAEESVLVDVGWADTFDVVAAGGVGVTVTVSTGAETGVGVPVEVSVTWVVCVVSAVRVTSAVSVTCAVSVTSVVSVICVVAGSVDAMGVHVAVDVSSAAGGVVSAVVSGWPRIGVRAGV